MGDDRRGFTCRARARPLALALVGVLLGCASAPAQTKGPEVLFGSVGENLLILPLNIAVEMPPKLEATAPIVWEELESYLREHGKDLKTVSEEDAAQFWRKSVAQVQSREGGATGGYQEATRVLVQKLSAYADFDTVIAPSLFIREAQVHEKTAYWDGVERPLDIDGIGAEARKLAEETPLEGAAPASSLHVVVLDAMGNKIQEAQGGLDLLVRVQVTAEAGKPDFEYIRRSDLFANRVNIREGIAVSLSPFLPRLEPATN